MPEKGWRKRLHNNRPKTPGTSKPTGDDAAAAAVDDPTDRAADRVRSQHSDRLGWRRIYHGSRPGTPVAAFAPTPGGDEISIEDTRSETGSDAPSVRGKGAPKPKLARYISDYLAITAPAEAATPQFSFSEPWSEDAPYTAEPPVDPLVAVQSIRSHIGYHSWIPLPVEYNSGILRVFEDYRKVRDEKERLSSMVKEVLDQWEAQGNEWEATECRYQTEIRRLELLIAQGTSGMLGLMKARQGSVVDRKRTHRQTRSSDRAGTMYQSLTPDQLDDEIRVRSQKVVLHRPTSPSGKMAALSKKFSDMGSIEEFSIGTPPTQEPKITLSRKVKSELDLMKLGGIGPLESNAESLYSGFSLSGDTLPDEVGMSTSADAAIDPGVECEAFVALRELATLVARRRGIDVSSFVTKLMLLYSNADSSEKDDSDSEFGMFKPNATQRALGGADGGGSPSFYQSRLRQSRSEPQLTAGNVRRHFSFEPGDDEIGMLNDELKKYELNRPKSPAGSQSTISSGSDYHSLEQSEGSLSGAQTLSAETPKPSKIPSPLQQPILGRPRRENSTSSLQTVSSRTILEERRGSRSSILTAFRENSSGSLRRPQPTSRASSFGGFTSQHQPDNDHQKDAANPRNNVAALAAARAASSAYHTDCRSDRREPGSEKGNTEYGTRTPSRAHQQAVSKQAV